MGLKGFLRSFEEAIGKRPNRKQIIFFKGIYKNIETMEEKYNELFHYLFKSLENINFVIKIPITGLSLKGPVSLIPRDGYPNISLPIKY